MTEEERDAEDRKKFVAKMLDDPERGITLFGGFMMAAMAGGRDPKQAAGAADQALAEIRRRFT